MSQHDYSIANDTGQNVRNDLNAALAAISSNNSGATEPSPAFSFQWWADTTNNLLKLRNAANSAWVTVGTLSDANLDLLSNNGAAMNGYFDIIPGAGVGTPGLAVVGDTDTGVWSPGANTLALVAGAIEYMRISANGLAIAKNFNGGSVDDATTGSHQTIGAPATPLVRLTSGTLSSIDGIPSGQPGQFLVLMNATGVSVTVNDETGTTAANRIRTGSGSPFTFQANAAVFMIYDNTSSRWRMIGGAGGSSRAISTFTGTLISPVAGSTDQTFLYTGGSSQTFTGFGTLSGLANGTRFRIIGSDDTNTLVINDAPGTDGWRTNGVIELGKAQFVDCEYNSTLGVVVIL